MTTASEVRSHFGVGYGSFSSAQFGYGYEEDSIIVAEPAATAASPAKRKRRQYPGASVSGGGGGGGGSFAESSLEPIKRVDLELERAARIVPQFARQPDMQRWTSSVLTASREDDLTTDSGIASALLSAAQAIVKAPIDKIVLLAAAFAAAGLSVFLVAHDDRPLVAVHVDGAWRYADPVEGDLGTHPSFLRERFFSVPNLPTPEQSRVRVELAEARLLSYEREQKLERQTQQLAALQTRLSTLEKSSDRFRELVIASVVVILVIALIRPVVARG